MAEIRPDVRSPASLAEARRSLTERARALLFLVPLVALAASVARGYRPQIPWAFTQAQFTCDLILKRCAFGQVLSSLHFPIGRNDAFAGLSTALLAVRLALYAILAARSRLPPPSRA